MRISESKNAPEWLKQAIVSNEDVEIINGIVIWKSGTWESGLWESGTWKSGLWKSGTWKSGTWKSGDTTIKSKWELLILSNGKLAIGCKEGTFEQWDKFFKSDDEFDTPRNTHEFKMIQAHFEAYKSYINFLNK